MLKRNAVMPIAETSVTLLLTGSVLKVRRSYTATASGTVTARPNRSPQAGLNCKAACKDNRRKQGMRDRSHRGVDNGYTNSCESRQPSGARSASAKPIWCSHTRSTQPQNTGAKGVVKEADQHNMDGGGRGVDVVIEASPGSHSNQSVLMRQAVIAGVHVSHTGMLYPNDSPRRC